MPRIRGASIEEHHEMVWAALAEAMRQLLLERDDDAINLGHIAARAGLARNTLYNYAPDRSALVRGLIERAGRPTVARVITIAERSADSATQRMREIIEAVLTAFTDRILQLMLRPASGPADAEAPYSPFLAIMVEVERVVRDGVASGEFNDVGDVRLMVELLSGVIRAGAERIGRDPGSVVSTILTAQKIVLVSLR